jgi:beta-glucosidase
VEHLSVPERVKQVLDAGCDQFGGEACPEVVVDLVRSGQVMESRLDESVRRLLREKFRLGLFDAPYLDVDAAEAIVGAPHFRAAGEAAQRRSFVLLKNGQPGAPLLPLGGRPKLYVENIAREVASAYGEVVATPVEADIAILRLQAPSQPPPGPPFGMAGLFHWGDLDFKQPELARILEVLAEVPTVVDIYLDRPAVIPEIAAASAALLVNFGAQDTALLDVVFGRAQPEGTLPFELPSSMAAVRAQQPDVPYDSAAPLYAYGYGLRFL